MIPIDHVLCAVDLSPASAHALRHARAWAWCYGATLRVLHVAPLPQALVSATGQSVVLPTRPLEAIRTDVERFVKTALTSDSRPELQVGQGYAVDTIVEESLFRGTNTGSFLGAPPTGRPVQASSISIYRIANGKIVEHWGENDVIGVMVQLGLMPPPGQPGS